MVFESVKEVSAEARAHAALALHGLDEHRRDIVRGEEDGVPGGRVLHGV